jgi:DNA-binding response OmpR family regulator
VEIALQDSGIEVAVVSDGTAALDVPEKNVKPFRVVITDINLGAELDRWEVARRACELNHALPIIYVSGASGYEWRSKRVPCSVMIAKPFTMEQLLAAISSLLKPT